MNKKLLKIEEAENGYIAIYLEEEDDGVFRKVKKIFSNSETEEDDQKTMENLLYFIADFFGFSYDKFSENNLNIKWNMKGGKYLEDKHET